MESKRGCIMVDVGKKREKDTHMTGEKFAAIRDKLGYTQTDLASILDYTSITISNFETNTTRIPKPLAILMNAASAGKVKLK